jgi:hypothetical protein
MSALMQPSETVYRITVFFKRRPDLTPEQFYTHWYTVHGPLVIPWALKYGVLEYTQFHTPSQLRALVTAGLASEFSGSLDFDGAADWYTNSYERYLAAFNDEYYRTVIEPDEWNFVDKGDLKEGRREVVRACSTMGVNRTLIKSGKEVATTDMINAAGIFSEKTK